MKTCRSENGQEDALFMCLGLGVVRREKMMKGEENNVESERNWRRMQILRGRSSRRRLRIDIGLHVPSAQSVFSASLHLLPLSLLPFKLPHFHISKSPITCTWIFIFHKPSIIETINFLVRPIKGLIDIGLACRMLFAFCHYYCHFSARRQKEAILRSRNEK